jgi:hypothetical protein
MDVATLAKAQTLNRIAIGTGLVFLPGVFGRVWAHSQAGDERAKVLARSLGVRDLALGAAGVLALRDGEAGWVRRAFGAQALADAVDFGAIMAGDLPRLTKLFGGAMAAGSAAVAAAYAARFTSSPA